LKRRKARGSRNDRRLQDTRRDNGCAIHSNVLNDVVDSTHFFAFLGISDLVGSSVVIRKIGLRCCCCCCVGGGGAGLAPTITFPLEKTARITESRVAVAILINLGEIVHTIQHDCVEEQILVVGRSCPMNFDLTVVF